jgi:hypothetical protein
MIFIAHKNPSPQLGSNLQPMGPVATTLTTTTQRSQPHYDLEPVKEDEWSDTNTDLFRLILGKNGICSKST